MRIVLYPLMNTLILLLTLVVNGVLGKNIGKISQKYQTLITPAGYAFSIWGLIYLLLLLFVGYQWYLYFRKPDAPALKQTGFWLVAANSFNMLWVVVWNQEWLGLSVVVILGLLVSLSILSYRLKLEIWDAPLAIIAFVWWPICLYLGWVILATTVNISAFLFSLGWSPMYPEIWAILVLGVAALIYLFLIRTRNLREAAMVGVWGISAIAYRQWEQIPMVAWVALGVAFVLFVAASLHAYRNRATSPIIKILT